MRINIYSFFSAVVCYSVFIIIAFSFRKIKKPKSSIGWPFVLSLYLLSLFRLFVPIEVPHALIVESRHFYPAFMCLLDTKLSIGFQSTITVLQALLIVWCSVSAVLFLRFFLYYGDALQSITKYARPCDDRENELLQKAMQASGRKMRVRIFYVPSLETPCGIGVFRRKILLPEMEYSDEALQYILLHECTHFKHHDIFLKLLVSSFCILFWWNPVVYLLKQDLEQILEIKCDMAVASRLSASEKSSYLKTMIAFLQRKPQKQRAPQISTALIGANNAAALKERFYAVTECCTHKKHRVLHLVYIGAFVSIVCTSYLFLPQPASDPPPIVGEFDVTTAYLLEVAPSEFELYIDGVTQGIISQRESDMLISEGFTIIKENSQ